MEGAELLEAGAIVGGGNPDVGVEIEAVELGLARAAGGDVTQVRLAAEATDAGAGPWSQRDTALDGGTDEAGQDRRDFCMILGSADDGKLDVVVCPNVRPIIAHFHPGLGEIYFVLDG